MRTRLFVPFLLTLLVSPYVMGESIGERSKSLISLWPLGNGTSDIVPDIARANNGRRVGGGAEDARVERGQYFDGKSTGVVVRNSPTLDLGICAPNQEDDGADPSKLPGGRRRATVPTPAVLEPCDFTIAAWVYTQADVGFHPIVDKRSATPLRGYALFIANGALAFEMADATGVSDFTSVATVADGQWHYVAVTVERAPARGSLYVDGRVVLTFTPRQGALTNAADLLIGKAAAPGPAVAPVRAEGRTVAAPPQVFGALGSDGFFQGVMRDVALYSRALDEKELAPTFADGASARFSTATSSGAFDIGIIPQAPGACPTGSQYVEIYMDDEDKNNASSLSGWVGATTQAITTHVNGTRFGFCRVDGSAFHNLGHANLINWENVPQSTSNATVGAYTYSVLKLGAQCPNGAKEIVIHIDNEDDHNQNSSSGNISPSSSSSNTDLYLCMFTPSTGGTTMTDFPQLGVTYGVFAGRFKPPSGAGHRNYWLQTGVAHTDDEDKHNGNYSKYPAGYTNDDVFDFTADINSLPGANTDFYIAKVRNAPCPNPCPTGGVFDGANCFMYAVPGNIPFVYNGNFYYAKVDGHPSSPCPHVVHDLLNNTTITPTFDSANCFIAPANGPNPFIWHGNYYLAASCTFCTNHCPFGGTYDGANCYKFTWPGVTPFIWSGNAYYAPVPGPGAPCPHQAYNLINGTSVTPTYDGANCVVFTKPGNGQQAFIYANKYYLTPACTP